ncbi:hypothetical protein BGY98DRAFT_994759, partial [Russula aff. rugulosa BPL654]
MSESHSRTIFLRHPPHVDNLMQTARVAAFVYGTICASLFSRCSIHMVERLYIRERSHSLLSGKTTSKAANGWNFYIHLRS